MDDEPCIHDMDPGTCGICKPPEPTEKRVYCVEPGCKEFVKDTRWDKTRAEGWFFKQNGDAWCPAHIPGWVEGWRAKQ